ncbi:MAG: diguanylate cyclase [Paucimonas sp.]|nr:diguanylate cyclase [Paucimonas sp.]
METKTRGLLGNVADLLLDAVIVVDVQGRIIYANAACELVFGYTPEEMKQRPMIDRVVPEDRARTLEEARNVMAGQPRIGFENRYIRKDGSVVHIMWSARWSEADQLRIGVARDVTERKHAEARQAAIYAVSEAAHNATDLAALFREIHQILAQLVPLGGLAVASRDATTLQFSFPYQMNEQDGSAVVIESIAARYCEQVVQSGQPMQLPTEVLRLPSGAPDLPSAAETCLAIPLIAQKKAIGVLILKSSGGSGYAGRDQELLHFVSAQIATVIERRQLHAELLRAARYDELTGLPNRRLFLDRMRSALARCRRKQGRLALLYIDIDNFKGINDTMGHSAGDQLLREVARRLQRSVREADTVSRLGGDEFVVILEEIHGLTDAQLTADKLRAVVAQDINVDGTALSERASIGIALYPEDGTDADQLLRHADRSMYVDKGRELATK